MVRAPCCEKLELKKGSWTSEEDLILINHINTHGHKNWRALPKQAGLLRCGKSCRLRWINYLRPGIKRGNFTIEEEDMIIQLHEMLGNRWSAIAAKLAGRTDNEIKNVWHTHLKKRLPQQQNANTNNIKRKQKQQHQPVNHDVTKEDKPLNSPQCVSSDVSTLTTTSDSNNNNEHNSSAVVNQHHHVPMNNGAQSLDDDFWSQILSAHNSSDREFQFSSSLYHNVDFWYDGYIGAQELGEF